jgi:hypothetical protein
MLNTNEPIISSNDMIYFKNKDGNYEFSGGFTLNSMLLNKDISPFISNSNIIDDNSLAMPICFLAINNSLDYKSSNDKSIDEIPTIQDNLYDKLLDKLNQANLKKNSRKTKKNISKNNKTKKNY